MRKMGCYGQRAVLCCSWHYSNRWRRNGAEMSVSRICWDTGGIDPTIVYERSKKHGLFRVIPIKGASVYGKPVASMPRKSHGYCLV